MIHYTFFLSYWNISSLANIFFPNYFKHSVTVKWIKCKSFFHFVLPVFFFMSPFLILFFLVGQTVVIEMKTLFIFFLFQDFLNYCFLSAIVTKIFWRFPSVTPSNFHFLPFIFTRTVSSLDDTTLYALAYMITWSNHVQHLKVISLFLLYTFNLSQS